MRMWLKHHYQDAEVNGPEAKIIKLSDIVKDATIALHSTTTVTPSLLSHAIKTEFPDTVSKKSGKSRNVHIFGLEARAQKHSLEAVLTKNKELEEEVLGLKQKVAELEQKCSLVQTLDNQMQALLHPTMASYHGPNSIDNFTSFSLNTLVEELRGNAPDVVELLSQLARCERFQNENTDDSHSIAVLRSTTALCTLLKGRSVKVLGLQLLLSFMMIARATSKEVGLGKGKVNVYIEDVCVCVCACVWEVKNLHTQSRSYQCSITLEFVCHIQLHGSTYANSHQRLCTWTTYEKDTGCGPMTISTSIRESAMNAMVYT